MIANGLRGDRFSSSGTFCKGWILGTVTRGTAKYTGWVQRGGLTGSPKTSERNCRRAVPFRDRIGHVNAPFRSITFRISKELKFKKTKRSKKRTVKSVGAWGVTGSTSQVNLRLAGGELAPDCGLHMNYVPGVGLSDPVGPLAKRLFKKGDMSSVTKKIGYRYTTTDGAFALVSVPTGFQAKAKGGRGTRSVGLWAFVKRDCVQDLKVRNPDAKANRVYQTEIRICNAILPSVAVKRFNRLRTRAARLAAVEPCELPNKTSKPGMPDADEETDGWNIGSLRLP